MRNILKFILICLVFYSCKEKKSTESIKTELTTIDSTVIKLNKEETKNQKTNDSVKIMDTIPIHIFKKGETLWNLSRKYYGNRHYSSILTIYNKVDVHNIEPGTKLKIPSLSIMLKDPEFGLYPILEKEIEKILEARELFMKHEKTLWELRKDTDRTVLLEIPRNVKNDITTAIHLIDETVVVLKVPKSDSIKVPKKMIGQLRSISTNLKNLSNGKQDGYGYDIDMVHQRLIHTILNGSTWSENNSK